MDLEIRWFNNICTDAAGNTSSALRKRAQSGPEHECSELLLKKADAQERMREKLSTSERFQVLLRQIDLVLQQIENQLAVNKGEYNSAVVLQI